MRLQGTHLPYYSNKVGRCRLRDCDKRPMLMCSKCKLHLCPKPPSKKYVDKKAMNVSLDKIRDLSVLKDEEKSCFALFHLMADPRTTDEPGTDDSSEN